MHRPCVCSVVQTFRVQTFRVQKEGVTDFSKLYTNKSCRQNCENMIPQHKIRSSAHSLMKDNPKIRLQLSSIARADEHTIPF